MATVMLGGARLAFSLSGRLGLATSHGLVFEGIWLAPPWARFPWLDCAGMLAFMCVLPAAWARWLAASPRAVIGRLDQKAALYTVLGVLAAGAIWGLRRAGILLPPDSLYSGSLLVLSFYWLIVAVAEETAFRGVIQHGLSRLAGLAVALPTATAAFVLWHGLPDSGEVLAIRVGGGLVLGLLYHGAGSLLPPIVCHLALNVALIA